MSNQPNLSKKDYIRFSHLRRFLTSQPYYVWHDLKVASETETDNNEFDFWELDLDEDEILDYAEVIKNGFGQVKDFFYKAIAAQASKLKKKIFFNYEINVELALKKTMAALNDPQIDWIVNPAFLYEDCLIRPSLYRKAERQVSSLLHSSKTKLINHIQAYFEVQVLDHLQIPLDQYSFFVYDKNYHYQTAPDLQFSESIYCWTQKGGPDKNIKKTIEEHAKEPIIVKVRSGEIYRDKNKVLDLANGFSWYIQKIRAAKMINQPEELNDADLTLWGENPHFVERFPFDKLALNPISGSLLQKKELLTLLKQEQVLDDLVNSKTSLKLTWKKTNLINFPVVKNLLMQIRKQYCIWYDFEGFSMPFVMLSQTKPYQQLVFQVSVIKTNRDEILKVENLVIDPAKINVLSFTKIIDAIYDPHAFKYVVYNKGYENSRLTELRDQILPTLLDEENLQIYVAKINHIIDLTFDLLDFFRISNSKTNVPPIFLYQMWGYSSIKKLENFITNRQFNFPVMIKPYKSLAVQNGLMAMNKAMQRYLSTIGDQEWKANVKMLKEYCENDVKAMIMVYYFICWLVDHEANDEWLLLLKKF